MKYFLLCLGLAFSSLLFSFDVGTEEDLEQCLDRCFDGCAVYGGTIDDPLTKIHYLHACRSNCIISCHLAWIQAP